MHTLRSWRLAQKVKRTARDARTPSAKQTLYTIMVMQPVTLDQLHCISQRVIRDLAARRTYWTDDEQGWRADIACNEYSGD